MQVYLLSTDVKSSIKAAPVHLIIYKWLEVNYDVNGVWGKAMLSALSMRQKAKRKLLGLVILFT